jgi:hypothetical protein
MSKYLVEVTDLDPKGFGGLSDPKALFDKDKFKVSNYPSSPFSSPFSPHPPKSSFSWELLLLATFVTLIISPDLRKNINFDYSPTSQSEQLLNSPIRK